MKLHPITQRFDDPAAEAEFTTGRAADLLPAIRSGTVLAMLLWLAAGPVVRLLDPSKAPALDLVFYVAMLPVHVLVAVVLSTRPGRARPEWWGALLNGSSGFAMLYTMRVLERPDLSFALIMVQVVFSAIALRLPFLITLGVTLPQLLGWAAFESAGRFDGTSAARAFLLFTVYVASLVGAYTLERSDRRAYLQERVIREQKKALEAEQAKSERLLLNVLPAAIAARLKEEPGVIADGFGAVTVLFSDLVGFTTLSARMPPAKLVELLAEVFARFDDLAEKHGLEKIKTIGDAYMVVGGLPVERGDHASAVAKMGLEMLVVVEEFAQRTGEPLAVRVGIHTGPVVAGVIGKRKFTYDLWGDTVNTASRMESHGAPGRVHVSKETHDALGAEFRFEPRGRIQVKGKGELETYFLDGPAAAAS